MRFTKMHGLGNDYLIIEASPWDVSDVSDLSRRMCDRHRGVGADGLLFVEASETCDLRMHIINSDGSEGRMCGNGIRCVAKYAFDRGLASCTAFRIETKSGPRDVECCLGNEQVKDVRVCMGQPRFEPDILPAEFEGNAIIEHPIRVNGRNLTISCVSVGNPHAVIFVDSFERIDVEADGRAIEHASMFPDRINVQFAQMVHSRMIRVRSWERGAGATQACGTGAVAVAAVADRLHHAALPLDIHLPGGILTIDRPPNGNLVMIGPAEEVFTGEWNGVLPAVPVERSRA